MGEKIILSACLAGAVCRYDGKRKDNAALLDKLKKLGNEFIAVCPEVIGGLPVPRPASQIIGGDGYDVLKGSADVMDDEGNNVTLNFVAGANSVLAIFKKENIKRAILKEKSPSCGVEFIYEGGRLIRGIGVLAALLRENKISVISDEAFLYDH